MPSSIWSRHHITRRGEGPATLLFIHGLGTHQGVWRLMAPALQDRFQVVLMDLAGCGGSLPGRGDALRYATLDGHAEDVAAVAERLRDRHLILVVHSIGCMIGLLADLKAPHLFDAHAMVAPSPCYLDSPGYTGGFDRATVDGHLARIAADAPAWAQAMAPALLGEDAGPALRADLVEAFRQADPQSLTRFAQASFLCDFRSQLPQLVKPVLVLQGEHDPIAPVSVGRYMQRHLPDCHLERMALAGHFPQLVAPQACVSALDAFLDGLGFLPAGGRPPPARQNR